ncbi:hypothetical protein QL285_045862 [Trifolium repens]|nr:hypothetical protein QL285_045862 [Trifolium repens]
MVFLRYPMTLLMACQCSLLGLLVNLHRSPTTYAMSGLVQSVAYLRLPMMLAYSICLPYAFTSVLKEFNTSVIQSISRFTVKVIILL